jgi:histidine triad (HIT) family protein
MDNCVFCEIIRTETAPGFIDHEAEYGDNDGWPVVSFIPLNPVTPGHRLFVPKPHFESAPNGIFTSSHAFIMAAEWAAHRKEVHCNIITSHGKDATQSILHTHIHYVPRHEGDGLLLPWSNQIKE